MGDPETSLGDCPYYSFPKDEWDNAMRATEQALAFDARRAFGEPVNALISYSANATTAPLVFQANGAVVLCLFCAITRRRRVFFRDSE